MRRQRGLLEKERALTKGWEAVGLAGLGEGGVHSGLGQRREGYLAGVGRHSRAERESATILQYILKTFTCQLNAILTCFPDKPAGCIQMWRLGQCLKKEDAVKLQELDLSHRASFTDGISVCT